MTDRASRLRAVAMYAMVMLAPAPAAAETLVLVEPPPALDAAVRASLAPWQVRVVVVDGAARRGALASAGPTGFVAWRDGDQLVLWDGSRATEERRPIPAELDDAAAASLALSIKTWMRLGPPPTEQLVEADPLGPPRGSPPGDPRDGAGPTGAGQPGARVRLGVEAGPGARANVGGQGGAMARLAVGVMVGRGPIELGVSVELGPGRDLDLDDTSSGTWSSTVAALRARWRVPLGHGVSVAPAAGVSLLHSTYRGSFGPQGMAVDAVANGFGLDLAALASWRRGSFAIGLTAGLTALPSGERLHDRAVTIEADPHVEGWATLQAGWGIEP